MLPHPLTNTEIQKYQNKARFNGVYSSDENGAYEINLEDYANIGTHWIALYAVSQYANGSTKASSINVRYLDGFGNKHVSKEIKKFISNKNITIYIYRIQAYDSIM